MIPDLDMRKDGVMPKGNISDAIMREQFPRNRVEKVTLREKCFYFLSFLPVQYQF